MSYLAMEYATRDCMREWIRLSCLCRKSDTPASRPGCVIPRVRRKHLRTRISRTSRGLRYVFRGTCSAFRVRHRWPQWQRAHTAVSVQGRCTRHEPILQVLTLERATSRTPYDIDTPLVTSVTRPNYQNTEHEPERILRDGSLRRDLLRMSAGELPQ